MRIRAKDDGSIYAQVAQVYSGVTIKLKQKIDDAIKSARKNGWKIAHSACVDPDSKCCCPMYAVVLEHPEIKVAKSLKRPVDVVITKAFCENVGLTSHYALKAKRFWALGADYRKRLRPKKAPNADDPI